MCKEYNGYSNYQTWNVALWLDNDEGSYNDIRVAASELCDDWALEQWLKRYVTEHNPLVGDTLGANMYADILGNALANVDYQEIAENIMAELCL